MRAAWLLVCAKELRESLRDRRVLFSALLVGPLMGPLIFAGMLSLASRIAHDREVEPLTLPVAGQAHAPGLVAFLRQRGVRVEPAPDDPERAIREQQIEVILRIAPDFAASWNAGRPARVDLLYDGSRQFADRSVRRAREVLQAYAGLIGSLRLQVRGIDPSIATALALRDEDLSSPQSRVALALSILPLLLLAAAFTGSINIAIDTTAGERERQSLEALLITPAARHQIALGKLAATTLFASASLLICVAGFALAVELLPAARDLDLRLGAAIALSIFAMTLPVALLAASSQMIIASGVNNFKEAQGYLQLFVLLPLVPGLIHAFSPFKPEGWVLSTPLLSQVVLADRLIRGDSIALSSVLMSAGTTLALACALCAVMLRLYRREGIALT